MAITNIASNSGSGAFTTGELIAFVDFTATFSQSVSAGDLFIFMVSSTTGFVNSLSVNLSSGSTWIGTEVANAGSLGLDTETSGAQNLYVGALVAPTNATITSVIASLSVNAGVTISYGWGYYLFRPGAGEKLNTQAGTYFNPTVPGGNSLTGGNLLGNNTSKTYGASTTVVSVTVNPRKSGILLGVVGTNGPRTDSWTSDSDTTAGSWVTTQGTSGTGIALSNGTTGGGSAALRAQYKITNGTSSQIFNPTLGTARSVLAMTIPFEYGAIGYWNATNYQNV